MTHRGRKNADDALALRLAMGQTLRASARAAGISEKTAGRRWADPEFRKRVQELRSDWMGKAAGRLVRSTTKAIHVLEQLLESSNELVQLSAARTLLDAAPKYREAGEIEERLRTIEEAMEAEKKDKEQAQE